MYSVSFQISKSFPIIYPRMPVVIFLYEFTKATLDSQSASENISVTTHTMQRNEKKLLWLLCSFSVKCEWINSHRIQPIYVASCESLPAFLWGFHRTLACSFKLNLSYVHMLFLKWIAKWQTQVSVGCFHRFPVCLWRR